MTTFADRVSQMNFEKAKELADFLEYLEKNTELDIAQLLFEFRKERLEKMTEELNPPPRDVSGQIVEPPLEKISFKSKGVSRELNGLKKSKLAEKIKPKKETPMPEIPVEPDKSLGQGVLWNTPQPKKEEQPV